MERIRTVHFSEVLVTSAWNVGNCLFLGISRITTKLSQWQCTKILTLRQEDSLHREGSKPTFKNKPIIKASSSFLWELYLLHHARTPEQTCALITNVGFDYEDNKFTRNLDFLTVNTFETLAKGNTVVAEGFLLGVSELFITPFSLFQITLFM